MTSFTSIPAEAETEAEYRAVSPWAVASLVLGLLSMATALGWIFVLLPLAGLLAGRRALRQFQQSGEAHTGLALARAGIATSASFGMCGVLFLSFVAPGVPPGYTSIAFEDLQPGPGELVSQHALDLQPTLSRDQKVFIKGFIYPGRRTRQIKEFLLVPTLGHCSFCFSQIRSTDIVRVKLVSDLVVDYRSTEIAVGGRLRVDQEAARNPWGQTPYSLEADYVK